MLQPSNCNDYVYATNYDALYLFGVAGCFSKDRQEGGAAKLMEWSAPNIVSTIFFY